MTVRLRRSLAHAAQFSCRAIAAGFAKESEVATVAAAGGATAAAHGSLNTIDCRSHEGRRNLRDAPCRLTAGEQVAGVPRAKRWEVRASPVGSGEAADPRQGAASEARTRRS